MRWLLALIVLVSIADMADARRLVISEPPMVRRCPKFRAWNQVMTCLNQHYTAKLTKEVKGAKLVTLFTKNTPAVYSGEKNMYGRPGHLPGSVNVFYACLLDPADGTLLPAARLKPLFDSVGAFGKPRVICYCGGGISATMNALALTLAGHPDIAVYDGSMAEWGNDATCPVAEGEE